MSASSGKNEEMKMTYSSFVTVDKRKCVSVLFERGSDTAEGLLPDGVIRSHKGFTDDEVRQLEDYLGDNREKIMEDARRISGFMHIFS